MSDTRAFNIKTGKERLDRFLATSCENLSRSRIRNLIAEGHVAVDGRKVKPSTILKPGQAVTLSIPDTTPSRLTPQAIPLNIVYEDGDLLVVDKPAGMAVHPSPGHADGTLANAVLAHCPNMEGIGGELRPGIVHRLDKDTSGLIVVAKNARSHEHLSQQFKVRTVSKRYMALVHGDIQPDEALIDEPIGRHPHHRKRMAIVQNGREAITTYRVLKRFKGFTLLDVYPKTGRTHQIRVHMSAVQHALVGDRIYGRPHAKLQRHFLHANRLGFQALSADKYVEFTCALPDELQIILNGLNSSM